MPYAFVIESKAGSILPDAPAAPPPLPPPKSGKPGKVPSDAASAPDQEQPPPESADKTDAPQWAGDLVENEDEISDPSNAFARFEGDDGTEAWLDKDETGTLTGWVQDGEDTYRYTDADAWATDVDDAGMTRVDDSAEAEPEDVGETEPENPDEQEPDARFRAAPGMGRDSGPVDSSFAAARRQPTSKKSADSKSPYGPPSTTKYADPGYQKDKVRRYPIDTEAHCRAAWSYIHQQRNAAQYTPKQLAAIKTRIKTAAKKFGIELSEN